MAAAVKAKRFRIGVEGATTDGREIQRDWLVEMAATYSPEVYTALINLEHLKSCSSGGEFRHYGRVTGLMIAVHGANAGTAPKVITTAVTVSWIAVGY